MDNMTEPSIASSTQDLSDLDLIERVRLNDDAAYAVLWERHHSAALKAARSITSSHDPEDLTQEAFTRVYAAIKNGKGPTEGFRAYLYTAMRSISMSWAGKTANTVDITTQEHVLVTDEDIASLTEDKAITARAFRDLPDDWRTILWYTEVEGLTPAEVAPLMGTSARAASALAFRAREGLRTSWLQGHVSSADDSIPEECKWTEKNLGAYARDGLSARRTERVQEHLRECNRCSLLFAELSLVGASLKGIFLPLVLGASPVAVAAMWGTTGVAVGGGALAGLAGGAGSAGSAGTTAGTATSPGKSSWLKANQTPVIAVASALALALVAIIGVNAFGSRNHAEPPQIEAEASGIGAGSGTGGGSGEGSSPSSATPDSTATESDTPKEDPTPEDSADTPIASSPRVTAPRVTSAPRPSRPAVAPSARPTKTPAKPAASPSPTPTPSKSPTNKPSPTPSATPSPTPSPTETTPRPTPTPDSTPSATPAPEPEYVSAYPLTLAEDFPSDSNLMPRFRGTAEAGSTIIIYDEGSGQAVTEPIEVIALSMNRLGIRSFAAQQQRSDSASTGTAPAAAAPAPGTWIADVSSTAPTDGERTYLVRNFRDGKEISPAVKSKQRYSIATIPSEDFEVSNLREGDGNNGTVQDGGTLTTATDLSNLELSFDVKAVVKPSFVFGLNSISRQAIRKSTSPKGETFQWLAGPEQTKDPSEAALLRPTGNTIQIRTAECADNRGANQNVDDCSSVRYGPWSKAFTFDIARP